MQVELKFDLDNIEKEDDLALEFALQGRTLARIIWRLDRWLRENYKYDKGDISIGDADIVRRELRELLDQEGLSFDHKIFS